MKNRRGLWAVTAIIVAGLVSGFVLLHSQAPPATSASWVDAPAIAAGASTGSTASLSADAEPPAAAASVSQSTNAGASPPAASAPTPVDAKGAMFKTDSAGRLITDEHARLTLEQLVALNDPPELQRKVREQTQLLPPAAAQQLPDLVERYQNYSTAQRQTIPPDQAPASEQEAITTLETLHALRVQHFGPEVAQGFFGSEEKMQRELIDLMRVQNDQSLSLQEKADEAQTLYKSMAELKARKEQH